MLSTAFGIIPATSDVYGLITRLMLPFSLFLIMLTVDLPAILKLGRLAIMMMLIGTLGIVLGGPLVYLLFKGMLPEDAWQGLASLSGSWIGGTANMVAVKDSVGASAEVIAPIIVIDTVVGYGWMGILLALSGHQERFDKWTGASSDLVQKAKESLSADIKWNEPTAGKVAIIVGLGIAAAVLSREFGAYLPSGGSVISQTTWAVIISVTVALILSFTRVRKLESDGASEIGYAGLYLLLAAIGSQADLVGILSTPGYFLAGIVWIAFHVLLLLIGAKLLKAPFFFVATGSMANIGGAATAPIVAGVYHKSMAPVGALMAVAGYIVGIYASLGCAWMLARLAGA